MTEVKVREEQPADRQAVRHVLVSAFPSDLEARLVDELRGRTQPQVSLVALDSQGHVVGHILFTPVELRGASEPCAAMGLAPMAVLPEVQRSGIGAALVRAGLEACRERGQTAVVVLGHADYYPRFGFRPAWDWRLFYGEPGPNPHFMAQELEPGALRDRGGEVVYHARFDAV